MDKPAEERVPHQNEPQGPQGPLGLARPSGRKLVAVTGATGYIGGRLVPHLLRAGYDVRALVRSPDKAAARPWGRLSVAPDGLKTITAQTAPANDIGDGPDASAAADAPPRVEIVQCDLHTLTTAQLAEKLEGVWASYYLVHSMEAATPDFHKEDMCLARRFAEAMEMAGGQRIVYLGGLGEMGPNLSPHLRSRQDVEKALASTQVKVTAFRAAMIIGSGSASYEILRYLVERLPVMVTPKWVKTRCQPIGVTNVLKYLAACLAVPETAGQTLEIGGDNVSTYAQLIREMAAVRGLPPRVILPLPVLTPKLSSHWIHLVTPLAAALARPLTEGLRNEVIVKDDRARTLLPQPLMTTREAIEAAEHRTNQGEVETAWTDAGIVPGDPDWAGGKTFEDRRSMAVPVDRKTMFRQILRIGGGQGYYAASWLWALRGFMDKLVGGPGLRRGVGIQTWSGTGTPWTFGASPTFNPTKDWS